MRDEESLTPASRLNNDSATSPTCAATATTTPAVASCTTLSRKATRSSTRGPYTSAATSPPTSPPTAPAHVFRGDNTGASFGPPIRVPAAMAHVSHTHVTASGRSTSATDPRGCASLCGPWRIATVNARRTARHRHHQQCEQPQRGDVEHRLPVGVPLHPKGRERLRRGGREPEVLEGLDALAAGEVVDLARAEHAEHGERRGEGPPAQPQHRHRQGNGGHREGDAHQQVAGHQAVILPKRRSRRW